MGRDIAEQLVEDFERGLLSRRQLVSRLMGLGATLALIRDARAGQGHGEESTFKATGIDHVALDVTSVPRSRDFYMKHLGLRVVTDGGEDNCFLGAGSGGHFFLTLFKGDKPGLNHYCYKIEGFDPEKAGEALKRVGLKPELVDGRVYFLDPDGIKAQVD
jgi:catechol 2,3-dioxygenase-like lactoylglutathione lyase family enzyme